MGSRLFFILFVIVAAIEAARRGRSLEDQTPQGKIPLGTWRPRGESNPQKPSDVPRFPQPVEKREEEAGEETEDDKVEPGKWKGALKRPIIVKNSIIINFVNTTTDPESIKTLIQALRRASDSSRQHDGKTIPTDGKTNPGAESDDEWPYDCESIKTDACRTLADAMCSSGSRAYDFPNCEKSFCISKAARCRMLVLMAKSCGAPQNHAVLQREQCEEALKGRTG